MKNDLRTLGRAESRVVLSLTEKHCSVVRTADIIAILGTETSLSTVRKVIYNLVRKGWLTRIVGGKYMFQPLEYGPENLGESNIFALATSVTEPCYIGWWSAASWHGLTTQKPMLVTVAVTRQLSSRIMEGNEVRFVLVTPRKFFGSKLFDVFGRRVPISSAAKTLVDCLDRPDLAGGPTELARITHNAVVQIEPEEILESATRFQSKAVCQRLGFLTDVVGHPLPDSIRSILRGSIPRSYRSQFGRAERRPGDIGFVAAWGIDVHARQEELLAEVPRIRPRNE